MTGNEAFFLSLCFRGLSLTPGVPHKGLGLQPLYPDGSDGQRDRLSGVSLPGQMEHGLLGVVTGIGTAFVEDQVVLLESENRGHEEYGGGGGGAGGRHGGRGRMPLCTYHILTSLCRPLPTLYQLDFCPSCSLTDAGSGTISQGSRDSYKTIGPTLLPLCFTLCRIAVRDVRAPFFSHQPVMQAETQRPGWATSVPLYRQGN